MKIRPDVAFRILSRTTRAMSTQAWGVYAVRKDDTLYAKAADAFCDEHAAVAHAAGMASMNPGKTFVAAPIAHGDEGRQLTRRECA